MRMLPSLLLLWCLPIHTGVAGPLDEGSRLILPGSGVAMDDGPTSTALNPALFGFDPDPGYSFLYRYDAADSDSAFQFASSAGGLGMGLFYHAGPQETEHWAISTSVALRFPQDWTLGTNVRWNLPDGEDNNFTTWDLGAGYRPLHFLGLGAVAQNIGNPAPELGVFSRYGVGLAARPFGDLLTLGLDCLFFDSAEDTALDRSIRVSLRATPARGLVLRLYGDDDGEVGGGLEIYFGEAGVGAWGSSQLGSFSDLAFTGAVLSSSPSERLFGSNKRVPEFRIDTPLPYQPRSSLYGPSEESYLHFLKRLHSAAEDRGLRGVLLYLDASPYSLAQVQEIRALLREIQAQDRPVVAYLDAGTGNAAYFLASEADAIYMHPAADLDIVGLSVELRFFRGSLDLLGIEPEFYRRSEYKSAVESFTRTEPSAESAEQTNLLLDDLFSQWIAGLSGGRGLEQDEMRTLVDGGPWTADEALHHGLVDGLCYPDELDDLLVTIYGNGFHRDDEYRIHEDRDGWKNPRRIAVVTVDGAIVSGPSSPPGLFGGGSLAGSDTIVKALHQAMDDDTVKAVVLRVDSPGGSAFASDDIWRAVKELRGADKPVVVSMGAVAASGGYYVAAGADAILAEPTTITGSIGVYGGKMSAAGLLDKLGMTSTQYTRGRKAGMWTSSRSFDSLEGEALQHLIDESYADFKARVAEGRDMEDDEVEAVARGRVWSGQRALEQGLVDELGGFYDAVDLAAELSGMRPNTPVDLITYGMRQDPLGELPSYLIKAVAGPLELPPEVEMLRKWSALEDEHLFMILPYEVEIQ